MRDPQHPLLEVAFDHGMAAFFMGPVRQHLLIGTDDLIMLTIPDLGIIVICQALAVYVFPDGRFALLLYPLRYGEFFNGPAFLLFFPVNCVSRAI